MPYKKKKDYNAYMREYMKELRKEERQIIRKFREMGIISTKIRTKKKKKAGKR